MGQLPREAGRLDLRHELVRLQGALHRVVEPSEGFEADRMAVEHADDGLIPGLDHRAVECRPQFGQAESNLRSGCAAA